MNAIAQWLKEKGKIVIPKTLDTQVFDENGKSLDRRLKTAKDEQVIQLPKVDPSMIFSDLDYSTEEQLTGKRWIDGKPLYEKTIVVENESGFPRLQTIYQNDMENIISVEKVMIYNSGEGHWISERFTVFPLGLDWNDNTVNFRHDQVGYDGVIKKIRFTIQYTKTTDTASSPVALPKVEAKHVYSTEEKVVGTWIDGKPLYEKTIVYDGIVRTDTKIYQNESIDEIVNVSNKCFYDTSFNKWNTEITSTYNLGITARGDYLQGEVNSVYDDRITKCRCTIQYTKTTDTATT